MNIVVFGATGGIGKQVVSQALERGHAVTAYVREDRITAKHERLKVLEGAIDNRLAIEAALQGADAVVWCVGIPLERKYDHMASLEGHRVLATAMDSVGVKRLIDWGTPSVPFSRDKKSFITVVPGIMAGIGLKQAKEEMVAIGKLLEESNLDWTMVRFMAPTDGPRTGNVKVGFGDVRMSMKVSRADIAGFMLDQLESDEYVRSMPIIGS